MIDRIDDEGKGGMEIIDYKTGAVKKSLGKDDKLQLMIYALAAKKVFRAESDQAYLLLY